MVSKFSFTMCDKLEHLVGIATPNSSWMCCRMERGHWNFMNRLFFFLFVCGMMAFAPSSFFIQAAQGADADEVQTSKLLTIFWGIVGYTRWPDVNVKGLLRICLSEDDPHSAIIRISARSVELGRPIVTRSMPEDAATACDIVYISSTDNDASGELTRSLAEAPVLTIGDGGRFCRMGGMFCLLPGHGESSEAVIDRFAVNQEAISRSPLRVDPQVLRLSKRNQER